MILKVNRKTGKEEVIATTSTSNINIDDPRLVVEKTPLSDILVDFKSQITNLNQYVKWLYKYGGTGSGGSGGAGQSKNAFVEVLNTNLISLNNDNIIYISENKLLVKYRIFQQFGTYTYRHTVTVNGKKIVDSQSLKSNIEASIALTDLSVTETNSIRISAWDEEGFNLQDYNLKIVSGSITLNSPTVANNGSISKYYGTGDIQLDFNINNRVKGSSTILEIKLNNMDDGKVVETFNNDGIISYRLNIMEQLNKGQMLETGVTYTITAQAFTNLNNQQIPSSVYTFTVALIDNKSLIIVLNGLSETHLPDDDLNLTTFLQGNDITFFYTINAASYSTFRVAFEITDDHDNVIANIGSILPPGQAFDDEGIDEWEKNKIVSKGTLNTFSFSTSKIPTDKIGMLFIKIYAWSIDGFIGSGIGEDKNKNTPIKIGKCKLLSVSQSIPAYTNSNNTMYLNIDVPIDFSDLQDKDTYRFSENVYDEQNKPIINNTRLDLSYCNHVSSGFIKNELTQNFPALRLAGGSYAHLDINYFNGANIGSWTLLASGWTFSITFDSDQHPDANGTIFSHGIYDSEGELINGIDISLEEAKCVFLDGSAVKTIQTTIIQNVFTTLDIVCRKNPSDNSGFIEIYLDGTLTAGEIIENPDQLSLGILSDGAYLGCKKVNDELTNHCDVNIYNVRIYKNAIIIPDIINNFVINHAHLSKYADGSFNWSEIELLKNRNFITSDWTNLLWDYLTDSFKTGTELYERINSAPVLPVVYVSETTPGKTFHDMYNQSYNEANAEMVKNHRTTCSMTYRDVIGNIIPITNMFVSLQGTSSMSYSSKNFEIYFGEQEDGLPRLFTPIDRWLPENQFTLKADVIDSAHANNTAIGRFINDYFEEIYPMKFLANPYRNKVKHTLEGFPVYMFMKFGDATEPSFLGIYNFNLGRGSSFNMGFKVLKNYELEFDAPSLVKSYEELHDAYNGGVFSFEFNTNSPTDLVAFQQPDRSIIEHIVDQRYPAKGDQSEAAGWKRLTETFDVFSRMYQTVNAPKKWIYDNGQFVETEQTVGAKIIPSMEHFPIDTNNSEGYIFWSNACRYFCATMAFGMVDSLGKNMTLRSWNVNKSGDAGLFYTTFYDMDTANALDNYGKEDIPTTCYIDYWYNGEDYGYTAAKRIINGAPDGVKGYDMPSSRLWEIIRLMGEQFDPGNVDMNYQSYWSELRKEGGLLETTDKFMDNYFLAHTKDVGAVIYNMDYTIKYLKKYEFQNNDGSVTTGYNDLQFLHGTRKNYVKRWMDKRLKYIDSCMNVGGLYTLNENTQWVGGYQSEVFKDSPYVNQWNGRGNGSDKEIFEFDIISNTPILFFMTIATNSQRVLLTDNKTTVIKFKGTRASSSTMSWNNTNNISYFEGFNQLNFNGIGIFTMRNLLNLDFSNIRSFDQTKESEFNISQLTELRNLNFEGMKSVNPEAGFIVNLSKCIKLKTVNIRNSDTGSLILPGGGSDTDEISAGVIEELLLSNSLLNNFVIKNQRFIKSLDFTDCKRLTNVEINSLLNLETIIFNNNTQIQNINISNCPALKTIRCNNSNALINFIIDNCENLDDIDISKCTNNQLSINLNGAFNLKKLDLSNIKTTKNPILPSWEVKLSNLNFYESLNTLNLNDSTITAFDFGVINNNSKYKDEAILDLSHFKNLGNWNNSTKTGLNLINNTKVKYIKFDNNKSKPYKLQNITASINGKSEVVGMFSGCVNLQRIFGHVSIVGNLSFNKCNSFYIHDEEKDEKGKTLMPTKNKFYSSNTEISKDDWNANIDLNTNISIDTTNLSSCFASSNVNLYNVYYILQQCENVINLSSCFNSCKGIITNVENSFNRDTFKYCGKATSVSGIFASNGNIKGIIYSCEHTDDGVVTKYNGLLSPLKSVVGGGLNSLFYQTNIEYIDDFVFYKISDTQTLNINQLITFVYGSNVQFVKNTGAPVMELHYCLASRLFKHLPQLGYLRYFLSNGISINFDITKETIDGKEVRYCSLFFNNKNMYHVSESFNSMKATGSWENIFGGQEELMNKYPNNFPNNIQKILNSFTVSSSINNSILQYPIRNDMFTRIKASLVAITGSTENVTTSLSSFGGAINKTYNAEDNDNEEFAYNVFAGCNKLEDISCFFKDLKYKNQQTVILPGDNMFKDTTELKNISYLFYNMVGVKFKLSGKGFINCKLTNVYHSFGNPTNTGGSSANIEGFIPYGLFYMEQLRTRTIRGWKDNDEINDKYGFDEDGNFIKDLKLPTPKNNSISYRDIRKTITNMGYALYSMSGTKVEPYKVDLGKLTTLMDSGDVLRFNEKYNPIKYIINNKYNADTVQEKIPNPYWEPEKPESPEFIPNPNYDNKRIILNPEYDSRFRIWNEYCVDGTNLRDIILSSELYKNNKESYGETLPESFYDINNTYNNTNATGKLSTMNYVCPPDLFLYCENVASVNVEYCLANSCRRGLAGDGNYGLYGRIPPMIFEPINKANKLVGCFHSMLYLVPYHWNYVDESNERKNGIIYHKDMLKTLGTNLRDISFLFGATNMPANCVIDDLFLYYNQSLQNLEGTWGDSCLWWANNNNIMQIPPTLFSNNKGIQNISNLLGNGTSINANHWSNSPAYIDKSLFTANNHKSITNISYFANRCKDSKGELPEFWKWTNIQSNKRLYAFNYMSKSKIKNLTEAKASKYSSSVTNEIE